MVTWQTSAANLAIVSNAANNKGEVFGLAAGSVDITATLNVITSPALNLTVTVDPDAPLSISTVASPNVILNNGTDSSVITATIQPTANGGVISDSTLIDFIITEDGVSNTVTKNTSGGTASHTITSTNIGFISVTAQVQNTPISSTSNILSTDSFSNVLIRAAFFDTIYDNGSYLANSTFGVITRNLSNRSFIIDYFFIVNGGVHFSDSPYSGSQISDGSLDGGEAAYILYSLDADTVDNTIAYGLAFSDALTSPQFGFSFEITYTPSPP